MPRLTLIEVPVEHRLAERGAVDDEHGHGRETHRYQ